MEQGGEAQANPVKPSGILGLAKPVTPDGNFEVSCKGTSSIALAKDL